MPELLQDLSSNSALCCRHSSCAHLPCTSGSQGNCDGLCPSAISKQWRFVCTLCYRHLVPEGVKVGKAVSLGVGAFKAWSLITRTRDCKVGTEVPGFWSLLPKQEKYQN